MQHLLDEEFDFAETTESDDDGFAPQPLAETPTRAVAAWPLEDIRPAGSARRITVAMAVLFVVGAAAVWWLARDIDAAPANPADQAVEAQVNAFLQYCGSQAASDHAQRGGVADQLVRVFNEYCLNIALPKGRIDDNPFVLRSQLAAEAPRDDLHARTESLLVELRALRLSSIMRSRQGATAIINNVLVGVGDTLGSFRITAIETDAVTLEAQGLRFGLKMPTEVAR